MESHSDYHGSPDGILETPFQNRNSRSLDTSPCGYQTTKSRTVQVNNFYSLFFELEDFLDYGLEWVVIDLF